MVGVLAEEVRKQGIGDGGERADGLEIANAAAVAAGVDAGQGGDGLIGEQNVAEFAAEAGAALDVFTFDDDAAAEAGADDGRDGGGAGAGTEDVEVAPEGGGVAVVQVGDGFVEHGGEAGAEVVAGPLGVDEVGGAACAEDALGAGRAGGVETDDGDIGEAGSGARKGNGKAVGDLLHADGGAFLGAGGVFAETVDEELFAGGEEGVVDRRAAEVDTGHKLLAHSVTSLLHWMFSAGAGEGWGGGGCVRSRGA